MYKSICQYLIVHVNKDSKIPIQAVYKFINV